MEFRRAGALPPRRQHIPAHRRKYGPVVHSLHRSENRAPGRHIGRAHLHYVVDVAGRLADALFPDIVTADAVIPGAVKVVPCFSSVGEPSISPENPPGALSPPHSIRAHGVTGSGEQRAHCLAGP